MNPRESTKTSLAFQKHLAIATFLFCITLYAAHASYAIAVQRHLYGDASWFLVTILSKGAVTAFYETFLHQFYFSRIVAYWITQAPTVLALHTGIHNVDALSWILGITYFGSKILSLIICYKILAKEDKIYIIFPLLAVFAGTINSDIYIVTETHIAVSFCWPIAILLTKREPIGLVTKWICVIGIIAASFTYESWAFFAPMLMAMGFYNAFRSLGRQRQDLLFLTTFLIIPAAVNWAAIIFPRDPTQRGGFIQGILKVYSDTLNNISTWHVSALVSTVAVFAIAVILACRYASVSPPGSRWLLASVLVVLAIAPPLHFLLYHGGLDFTYAVTDRGFGGLAIQVLLLFLFTVTLYFLRNGLFLVQRSATAILIALAIGQMANQALATNAWANALTVARITVATENGALQCATVDGHASSATLVKPSSILCSWWSTPLSILLAKDEYVHSLLLSPSPYQAFDPFSFSTLPHFEYGGPDYSRYLDALHSSLDILPGPRIRFVSRDPHVAMLRGFSYPEQWATWTDSNTAAFHFCFANFKAPKSNLIIFRLAPLLTPSRTDLPVLVSVPGGLNVTWDFHYGGPPIVSKSILVQTKDLSASSCGIIVFHLPSALQSPLAMGISGDPRRLGFALLDVQVTKP